MFEIARDRDSLFSINNFFLVLNNQIDVKPKVYIKHNLNRSTLKISNGLVCIVALIKMLQIFNYKLFIDMTAFDTLNLNKGSFGIVRFYIFYLFGSLMHNTRFIVSLGLNEKEVSKSIVNFFAASNWSEREIFDMFGIYFAGNPNMKRILTDYGFNGFPMRKDFPVIGFKEVSYNAELETILYLPVSLMQEERIFELYNPWISRAVGPVGIFNLQKQNQFLRPSSTKYKVEQSKKWQQ